MARNAEPIDNQLAAALTINRRGFVAGCAASGAVVGVGLLGARKYREKTGSDDARYFSEDWLGLGYEKYYHSLFEVGRSGGLSSTATGPEIRPEIRKAFGGAYLHAARQDSFEALRCVREDDYSFRTIKFVLDCGLPVLGSIGVPHTVPKGLVILAHGISTTPDRCFNSVHPGYMRAIGSRLCMAGFAVWCPFIPQAGNQASLDDLAGMLSFEGISYHSAFCSALHLGPWVLQQLKLRELRTVRYGVSWGSIMSAHLEAAIGQLVPTVLSGYLRDEKTVMESSWLETNASLQIATYLHELPCAATYFLPKIARVLRPCRLYFEVGNRDGMSNNAFGRDTAFAEVQAAYREVNVADFVKLEVFEGGHEAAGTNAIAWLSSVL